MAVAGKLEQARAAGAFFATGGTYRCISPPASFLRQSLPMAEGDLQREILQRTLKEVADEETESDPCVICLETITEPSVAVPCHHSNFDYLCLLSWLEQQPNCPLCKVQLTKVQYDLKNPRGPKAYNVPLTPPSGEPHQVSGIQSRALAGGLLIDHSRRRRPRPHPRQPQTPSDDPLAVRRSVYRNQLYSLRVGSNRLSQYSEVTPEQFNRDETLVSRARKWIRRELQVFAFLNPGTEGDQPTPPARPGPQRLEERRANNAEFLLEYVIAILRTVDIKGSAGQAEELLRDFIGRDNARFIQDLRRVPVEEAVMKAAKGLAVEIDAHLGVQKQPGVVVHLPFVIMTGAFSIGFRGPSPVLHGILKAIPIAVQSHRGIESFSIDIYPTDSLEHFEKHVQ
ncbi:hypothetical protein PENDEC_c003G01619 [Penicillium decumbens]|uniref:RING-type E3 ubiquitin transferase n=1 Tax=Penicillium decumbens TaxID=69771 RepID=A0A1V6PJK5_PENDC|nr:hypothetical protein PENDEC_c003G01619 [Penicillium decumbens]